MVGHSQPVGLAAWVGEAAGMPVAFAQVREDPLLDLSIVDDLLPDAASVLMIASGGCTAALLAASPRVARLHMVDPNPAQLALARLKLRLLTEAPPAGRAAILGHGVMPKPQRAQALASHLAAMGEAVDVLGPLDRVAAVGPDHAGRYELVFAALRDALREHREALAAVLGLDDVAEQSRRVEPGTALGDALDAALDEVMSQECLVALFGVGAQQNRVEPFSRHLAGRVRHVLATRPAAGNPYLWQMLLGRYPPGVASPWLGLPRPTRLAAVTWECGFMADALAAAPAPPRPPPEGYDMIHLSNILDWLPADEARRTLQLTHRALKPGGWTIVRQLNSTVDVRSLQAGLAWDVRRSDAMHAADRSFFYRALHLGQRA
jgi:S-adenosylmethionine-diacylglycerol 3-amino-3-carboxypropyl transferase